MAKAYYGKSMYGGWYIEEYTTGTHEHFDTYKQMKAYAKANNIELAYRWDN